MPSTYIDDAWVRLTRDGRIAATVKLDGPEAGNREVRLRVPTLGFVLTGTTSADGTWNGGRARPAGSPPLVAGRPDAI